MRGEGVLKHLELVGALEARRPQDRPTHNVVGHSVHHTHALLTLTPCV